MYLGYTLIQMNGTFAFIGGVLSKRSQIRDLQLKGTILNIILPSMSLIN